jgi:hypothetical protein
VDTFGINLVPLTGQFVSPGGSNPEYLNVVYLFLIFFIPFPGQGSGNHITEKECILRLRA